MSVWIDHRKAVIAVVSDEGEETQATGTARSGRSGAKPLIRSERGKECENVGRDTYKSAKPGMVFSRFFLC